MRILGLNFGHDAGVSLVVDGVFERHWEKERHVRIKHAMGLSADDVLAALDYMGTDLAEVDRVALTCTQNVPIMLFGDIDLRFARNAGWPLDGVEQALQFRKRHYFDNIRGTTSWFRRALDWAQDPPHREIRVNEDLLGRRHPDHDGVATLDAIRGSGAAPPGQSRRMCIGLELRLGGRTIPGAYVSHHLCHAHYAYAESAADRVLVLTADGVLADSFKGGGVFFARNGGVEAIVPLALWAGAFYENVASRLWLGQTAAGKLMGLAAWGEPRHYDPALIGNWFELPEPVRQVSDLSLDQSPAPTIVKFWQARRSFDFGPTTLGRLDVPPRQQADVAASAQKIFEQNMLKAVDAARGIARNAGFEYDAIALAGGCALNCPANSLVHREFGERMFIPPAINDEGNSAGAALALHSLLAQAPRRAAARPVGRIAYKGKAYPWSDAALEPFREQVEILEVDAPSAHLARALHEGAIAGIFDKGAEIGPRALGHRSLVGSPLIADNWRRLNRIKRREQWRPLAPIALPEDAAAHFEDFPPDSHYMLFNARARTDALPAVTHVDGTARVQVADPENGFVFELLQAFKGISGWGVLMNTSFNGPDEPIVETPGDALRAFVRLGFDLLYLDGVLLRRRRPAGHEHA